MPTISKETAYVKAVKFVISALLHKKEYATINDEIRDYLLNSDYIQIFDYIKGEKETGRTPIISKLFDMFDVEGSADIGDVVNFEFVEGEDNEKYYEDCVNVILKSGLSMQKDKLLKEMAKTKDMTERAKIASEIQKIILKEKKK